MLTYPLFGSAYQNEFSLETDGVNEYVDYGDVLNFERTDRFSISFWHKPLTQGVFHQLVTKMQGSNVFRGWQLYRAADNKIFFWLVSNNSTGNQLSVSTTSLVNTAVWRHIVMTYDASSSASGVLIYIDGALESTIVFTDALTSTTITGSPLQLGRRSDGSGPAHARFDELAIYDKTLSSVEVGLIYGSGKPNDLLSLASAPNLQLWSRFTQADKAAFPTISDHSTNSNNGTSTNGEVVDIQSDTP